MEKEKGAALQTAPQTKELPSPSITDFALRYAFFRWRVLPLHGIVRGRCTCGKANCESAGKHPLTVNGVKDASSDPDVIRAWWRRGPAANVGIATGGGLVVLDVDPRHGGLDSLKAIQQEHGPLPVTVTVTTGGGGYHFYFTGRAGNKVGLRPGLDLRGEGGYVVAPPSLHLSGRRYEWVTGRAPQDLPLAPLPPWLLPGNATTAEASTPRAISSTQWQKLLAGPVPEGRRNDTLTRLTGHLLRRGVNPFLALELVLAFNQARCDPPLPEQEVVNLVNSVAGRELRRRGGIRHAR